MAWPKNTDYYEAIQNPAASLDDEELRGGEVACTPLGLPMLWTGSFADVYKLHCPATGNTWAVKCFTREVRHLQERYRSIALCLEQARLPFTVDFQYLERGIRIAGAWFPVLKMRWVEGLTLNQFVEEHLQRPRNLKMLLELWVKLAERLHEVGVAHADLQHGNVLLVPMARGALALRLIDYDGMYVPALAGTRSGELGHPAYQHPQRLREGTYNAEVDRFSHLVIYTAVRCLMVGRNNLWQRFNNGDNLLFREADFQHPGSSEVFRALWALDDADAHGLVGRLILACQRPLEESPLLYEIVTHGRVLRLGRGDEIAVEAALAAPRPAPVASGLPERAPEGAGSQTAGVDTWLASLAPPVAVAPPATSHKPPATTPLASLAPPVAVPPPVALPDVAALPAVVPLAAAPAASIPPAVVTAELVPEAPVSTRPASQQGTLPAAVPQRAAEPTGGRIFSALGSVVAAPARAVDGLLLRMVSPDNTIVHNFARVVAALAIVLLIALGVKAAWPLLGGVPASPEEESLKIDIQEPAAAEKPQLSIEEVPPQPAAPLALQPTAPPTVKPGDAMIAHPDVVVPPPTALDVRCDVPASIAIGQPAILHVSVDNLQPADGSLEFSCDNGPPGATIDKRTGEFTWTPPPGQSGRYNFAVSVKAQSGRTGSKWLSLMVRRPTPLFCQWKGPAILEPGQTLSARVVVLNPTPGDGKLEFSLERSPPGATIDASTGEVSWSLPPGQSASYLFTITVKDASGRAGRLTYTLLARALRQPLDLRMKRPPNVEAKPGQPVSVQLSVLNPQPADGKLKYTLDEGPPGAKLDPDTGEFTWTPPPEPPQARGPRMTTNRVMASVKAESGRAGNTNFLVRVRPPTPPHLSWDGPRTIEVGQELTAQVSVQDAQDWGALQYTLIHGPIRLPPNAKFDRNTGAFTWKPTARQIGKYTFTVQVQGKDRATQTVTDNVTLTVTKPLRPTPTRP
jgi:hypothetical protein